MDWKQEGESKMTPEQQRISDSVAYCPETGVLTWKVSKRGGGAKAGKALLRKNNYGYMVVRIDGKDYVSHRIAWLLSKGFWPEGQIDHINGIRDDNRLCNLRDATVTENRRNCIGQPGKRKYSRFKGVGFVRSNRYSKWVARIVVDKNSLYLGAFKTEDEAASAYIEAEKKFFGEYASSLREK